MASKVFLIRHGETEWSLNQQHTGSTEIPLTPNGEEQVRRTARTFIGDGKIIQPKYLKQVFCSPRVRARRTLQLLGLEDQDQSSASGSTFSACPPVTTTELLQEWNYGNYEGLNVEEVRRLRASRNLDINRNWNIWIDGCEGGESPQDVTARLDRLIEEIKNVIGTNSTGKNVCGSFTKSDIVCVAHGHILSALALRWAEQPLQHGMRLLIETAGVGVLCFEHGSFEEPAVLLGARAE